MNAYLKFILIVQILLASISAITSSRPKYCLLEKKTGRCRAYIRMYYYDQTQGKCLGFIYGGCNGNANRFKTREECEKKCNRDVCSLDKDPGFCKAAIPRYFYNSNTKSCEMFIYGGCPGNQNNFETLQECKDKCQ